VLRKEFCRRCTTKTITQQRTHHVSKIEQRYVVTSSNIPSNYSGHSSTTTAE
jgi:hypothetical protein